MGGKTLIGIPIMVDPNVKWLHSDNNYKQVKYLER